MKIKLFLLLVVIALVGIIVYLSFSTSREETSGQIVARINNFNMTADDLQDKIYYSPDSYESAEDLDRLLDLAIQEQVLIQEAQRLGLDKRKSFMKMIERYWKQALIKELIDAQSSSIDTTLREEQQVEELKNWMDGLNKKAEVEINKEILQEFKQELMNN
ncbi:hypothetical protein ACFL1E_05755 [Candidatus Omnitrophota bacterium]